MRNLPSGENSHEVTMTWLAPASIHEAALSIVTPPPSCIPFGQAERAAWAASLLPGPSWMMCPPVRL